MVKIFRSYHPAVIFLLLVYTFFFRVILFVEPVPFQPPVSANYLSQLVYDLLRAVLTNHNGVYHVMASLLVFFQALYFNYLINYYRILSKPTYLPAMSYLLISSLFIEFTFLTPALMGNTFLLFSLSKIFSTYKKEKALASIFDAALLVAVASLFFFPYIVFFLFIIAALMLLRPFNFREYVLSIFGLIVPYYFIGVYFFWYQKLPAFWQTIRISELSFPMHELERSARILLTASALLVVTLWNFYFIQANLFRMVVQVRSYLLVFILFFAAGVVSMLVQFNGELYHFVWMAIPFGLAFAIFFLELRRKWVSEFLHLFLLLTLLFFQYFFFIK